MVTTAPKSVKIWGSGQLTIPRDLRIALHLDESAHVNIFAVGPCLVLTSKSLMRSALAKNVQKSMKEQGMTLKDLLKDLKDQRRRYSDEKS